MKKVLRIGIAVICMVSLVVGYYTYLSRRNASTDTQNNVELSEVQAITSKNFTTDYPATPRAVVKWYNRIIAAYYAEEYDQGQLEKMADQARMLMDDELLQYNPRDTYLAQLNMEVTDYKNRTVAYEYNEVGAKTKLTYPDGRTAAYSYNNEGKLSSITGNGEKTSYTYDALGRLTEKLLPNGVKQAYSYLPGGNLLRMESSDKEGTLDRYFYTYDKAGLISGINRSRR